MIGKLPADLAKAYSFFQDEALSRPAQLFATAAVNRRLAAACSTTFDGSSATADSSVQIGDESVAIDAAKKSRSRTISTKSAELASGLPQESLLEI